MEDEPAGIRDQGLGIRVTTKPNPFIKKTYIQYQHPAPGTVRLIVYNAVGQVVRVLAKEAKRAGAYQAVWDGRNGLGQEVGSGVYFVRLEAGNYAETRKVVLIR